VILISGLVLVAFAYYPVRRIIFHLRRSEEKLNRGAFIGIILCTVIALVYTGILMGANFFY
jgi:beta-lactamase regulating signal transducer with metallopeptidase domain